MTKPQTILILEDETTIRENLTDFLEDEGYEIIAAESGEAAVSVLEKNNPALAIVDIRLPGMDGNQWMIEAARQQPNMQFIVYTGVLDYVPSEPIHALGVRDEDVLYKPADMADIANLIQTKLASS